GLPQARSLNNRPPAALSLNLSPDTEPPLNLRQGLHHDRDTARVGPALTLETHVLGPASTGITGRHHESPDCDESGRGAGVLAPAIPVINPLGVENPDLVRGLIKNHSGAPSCTRWETTRIDPIPEPRLYGRNITFASRLKTVTSPLFA